MRKLSRSAQVLISLIIFRLINLFFVTTWFVPDEYWQSLEVAHSLVYQYGYLTWEWKVGIRSYLYPLLFASFYKFLEMIGLSNLIDAFVFGPRIIQAILSALGDWCFYNFVQDNFTSQIATWALFCLCTSWCWWYCATRTLINSFEAAAVCIALRFYNWKQPVFGNRFKVFVLVSIIATMVRPTSLTVWIPMYIWFLYRCYHRKGKHGMLFSLLNLGALSSLIIFALLLVDRYCYGDWRNVHYNFVKFNVLQNRGSFYGSHPWHWYLTQGLPIVLGTHLFFALYGTTTSLRRRQKATHSHRVLYSFVVIIVFSLLLYSIPGHKEFRFILPLLSFCMVFSAVCLASLSYTLKSFAALFLIITNVTAALYTGLIHQSAPLAIIRHLHTEIGKNNHGSILFLLPCHSTPYYSHLHHNVTMRFLTCEPNFSGLDSGYLDEADTFYLMPKAWLHKHIKLDDNATCHTELPQYIVLYDILLMQLSDLLSHCYAKHVEVFHTHFPEGRIGNNLLVLKQK